MTPLLFIHGTGGDAASFDLARAALESRYRVLAYDRSGYGRPHAAHADDALAVLDAQAPDEPAVVVGSSAGAIVALHVALKRPERVRVLVLAEPPLWARKTFDAGMMAGMLRYGWHLLRGRRREAVAAFFRAVTRYRDGGGNGVDAMTPEQRERALAHADDVLAEVKIGTGEDLTPALLATIAGPTTLLLGARSGPFFARITNQLAALLPNARVVMIPGAGHLMMLESPVAFADAIIAADTARRSSRAA